MEERQVEVRVARVLGVVALDALDFLARSEHERDALVQRLRRHVEHRAATRARAPARLLDQETDGIRLVEQPQPSRLRRILAVARIEEDAAAHEDAVRLGHEGGDPAHVEVAPARSRRSREAFGDVAAHRRLPEAAVGRVDREFRRALRDAQVAVGEQELADRALEGERVHAAAHREHQHRAGPVDRVARRDLRASGLQEGTFLARARPRAAGAGSRRCCPPRRSRRCSTSRRAGRRRGGSARRPIARGSRAAPSPRRASPRRARPTRRCGGTRRWR